MSAFSEFYKASYERLAAKAAAYNVILKAEEQPLLQPVFADMADLNEGGKMLRGVLVALGCQIASHAPGSGGEPVDISISDAAALAFEVFQTGVLIHDDIIDRASLRRGKATMTVRYEDSLAKRGMEPPSEGDDSSHIAAGAAICAGDYLITASNLILCGNYGSHPRAVEIIGAFDRIILDTIRGEMLDVILPTEMTDPSRAKDEADALLIKAIEEIYHLKTARYSVVGPLHLGLLIGGMPEDQTAPLDAMADELGIAFQIKDDILGIYADETLLGKDVGSDISEFKQTLLYAYVKLHDADAYDELMTVYGRSELTEEDVRKVQAIFERTGARAFAEAEMEKRFGKAEGLLDAVTYLEENDREILRDFIRYNRDRRK